MTGIRSGPSNGRASPAVLTVGGRVHLLREGRGWTQAALAQRAGLSQPTVANFERGRTTGGLAVTLAKLAKALNVNPEWLRTGQGDPSPRLTAGTDVEEIAVAFGQLSPQNRQHALVLVRSLLRTQD